MNPPEKTPPQSPATTVVWLLLIPLLLMLGSLWQLRQSEPASEETDAIAIAQKRTIYVPGDDAMLHPKRVQLTGVKGQRLSEEKAATLLLRQLMQESPDDFPRGTQLEPLEGSNSVRIQNDGVLEVNFNKAFAKPTFWQGSAQTLATVYAVVNTLTSAKEPARVRILVHGEPVQSLGELDLSEPLEAKLDLVAAS